MTSPPPLYSLSLHDALPIWGPSSARPANRRHLRDSRRRAGNVATGRTEEHTSELQSLTKLVFRLLLEKTDKKQKTGQRRCKSVPSVKSGQALVSRRMYTALL